MDVRVGLWRRLSTEELMLLNCGVGEDFWESLGLQGDPTSPSCKDITLPTKVRLVKAMFFPVVTYGCESWTIKKAEHRRIDAIELRCWRRLLRVPWTARRSNQSILKEIDQSWVFIGRTDAEAETPVFWPPHVKNWLTGKDPDAGKDWRQEEKGTVENEMVRLHHQLNGQIWANPGDSGG